MKARLRFLFLFLTASVSLHVLAHTVTLQQNGNTTLSEALDNAGVTLPNVKGAASIVPDRNAWITAQSKQAEDYVGVFDAVYYESSVPQGDVITQTATGLAKGKYIVSLSVAASYTSGRGFECPTGDRLTEVFAGSKKQYIPVVDRTWIGVGDEVNVKFIVDVDSKGTLTYGIRNVAASGNWYIIRVNAITRQDAGFLGWYDSAGNKVGDAGDMYYPKSDVTLRAKYQFTINNRVDGTNKLISSYTATAFDGDKVAFKRYVVDSDNRLYERDQRDKDNGFYLSYSPKTDTSAGDSHYKLLTGTHKFAQETTGIDDIETKEVIFLSEAEDMSRDDGFTPVTNSYIMTRCSNGMGASIAKGSKNRIITLGNGRYRIIAGFRGYTNKDRTDKTYYRFYDGDQLIREEGADASLQEMTVEVSYTGRNMHDIYAACDNPRGSGNDAWDYFIVIKLDNGETMNDEPGCPHNVWTGDHIGGKDNHDEEGFYQNLSDLIKIDKGMSRTFEFDSYNYYTSPGVPPNFHNWGFIVSNSNKWHFDDTTPKPDGYSELWVTSSSSTWYSEAHKEKNPYCVGNEYMDFYLGNQNIGIGGGSPLPGHTNNPFVEDMLADMEAGKPSHNVVRLAYAEDGHLYCQIKTQASNGHVYTMYAKSDESAYLNSHDVVYVCAYTFRNYLTGFSVSEQKEACKLDYTMEYLNPQGEVVAKDEAFKANMGSIRITDPENIELPRGLWVGDGTVATFTATAKKPFEFARWSNYSTLPSRTDTWHGRSMHLWSFFRDHINNAPVIASDYHVGEKGFVKDEDNNTLVAYTYGGWMANIAAHDMDADGKITRCSATDGHTAHYYQNYKSGKDKESFTDSWEYTESSDLFPEPEAGYGNYVLGRNNAKGERYDTAEDNVKAGYPFTLPVRGTYMTFDPVKNGVLSVYILQNGCLDKDEMREENKCVAGDAFTLRKVYIMDGQANNVTGVTWKTNQKVEEYIYDGGDKKFVYFDLNGNAGDKANIATWPGFKGLKEATDKERFAAAWVPGENAKEDIVALNDGSYSAVWKCMVKYTFRVNAGQTYYIFSNNSKIGYAGCNFIVEEQPDNELTLDHEQRYTPQASSFKYNGKDMWGTVNVKRGAFTADAEGKPKWNTICLPFSMTEQEVRDVFGEGTELIILDNVKVDGTRATVQFRYHEIQAINAGYPYLIRPGKAVLSDQNKVDFVLHNKMVDPDAALMVFEAGSGSGYRFKGTDGFSTADVSNGKGTDNYSHLLKKGDIFLNSNTFYISKGTSFLKGYRAYIDAPSDGRAMPTSISFEYSNAWDEYETPTAISMAEMDDDALATFGTYMKGVYTLSGQKVGDSTDGLTKGIYIVNGQKVTVE